MVKLISSADVSQPQFTNTFNMWFASTIPALLSLLEKNFSFS